MNYSVWSEMATVMVW